MDLMRLLTGFVALTIVTFATSQRFPTQHPFHPIAFLPEDGSNEGDFEPSRLPLQSDEQQRLKTIGSLSTPAEITFDSYNAAFPAQLRPFRLENQMYWPPDQQKEQLQQQQPEQPQHAQLSSNCNDKKVESFLRCKSSWLQREEQQIYGNGNDFDDMLYPDADDVTASTEHDDDGDAEKQNIRNTKDPKAMFLKKPTKLWMFPLLLKDTNKHHRNAGAARYYMRQSDQLKTGGKEGYEKRTLNDDFMPKADEYQQLFNDDSFVKRNAFRNIKRQKSKSHDTRRFLPSISPGAMTHLGHFFKDLKSNVNFMENQRFGAGEQKLLEGDHPVALLREELLRSADGGNPTTGETAAFLNAIRTYHPSQKIRSLVSMNPEGYHGSEFLDPNYMWLGLGK